jgi:DNA polymerase V
MVNSALKILHPARVGAPLPRPLVTLSCGFPSPAQDYLEPALDLNELLIKHPAATFFGRVQGNSMSEAQIFEGDVLIIDRAINPRHNHIVLAVLQGEFTVKRLFKQGEKVALIPANPQFKPTTITADSDFSVWGVVTYIIHQAR